MSYPIRHEISISCNKDISIAIAAKKQYYSYDTAAIGTFTEPVEACAMVYRYLEIGALVSTELNERAP